MAKKTSDTNQKDRIVKIGGHDVQLTNQGKIYFPEGYTKGDVVAYYQAMSKYILSYLKNRPQSMFRTPQGALGPGFFQKDVKGAVPDWAQTLHVPSESRGETIEYLICNDKATLAYMSNLGCVELNPWNSRIRSLLKPDYIIIDIDPSNKNTYDQVVEVALVVKEILDKAGAPGYCKTSGATGMHIYIPLGAKYSYQQGGQFAEIIATMAHEALPKFTSITRSLEKRGQKIYIDYLQNRKGQTLACAYSLRPRPGAPASAPLKWSEVKKGLDPLDFNIKSLPKRVAKVGDLFNGVLGKGIDISKCIDRISES